MTRVSVCPECGGDGLHVYETGAPVERCPRCRGVGVVFASAATAARDFRDALTAPQVAELALLPEGVALRVLADLAASLEAQCEELERELGRLR